MEIDFPRGGDVYRKQAFINNDEDESKKKVKKKKNVNSANNDKYATINDSKNTKFVKSKFDTVWTNRLSLNVVTTGLTALACVESCTDCEVKVELIDGLKASIPITAVSNVLLEQLKRLKDEVIDLKRMFTPGQLLVIKVSSIESDIRKKSAVESSKKRQTILVTTEPKEVNANLTFSKMQVGQVLMASIKSVEDKGFYLDIGSTKTYGFLPFAGSVLKPTDAIIGQVLLCRIAEFLGSDKRVLKLKLDYEYSTLEITPSKDNLLPGNLLSGTIERIRPNGLFVKLSDTFVGFVAKNKLSSWFDNMAVYTIGEQIDLVVTYDTPNSNMIGFSAQKLLFNASRVDERFNFSGVAVGDKKTAVVKTINAKNDTVYFEISDESIGQQLVAMVTANELELNPDDDAKVKYAEGTKHALRIIGLSLMNHLFYATCKKSRINQAVISIDSAVPGTKVEVVVKRAVKSGVFVKVCDYLNGFIPALHATEAPTRFAESKFKVGDRLKARILNVDCDKRRLILTAKKSMVKSRMSVLTSYDESSIDCIFDGVVVKIESSGILVAFYGDARGYLSRTELASAGVVDVELNRCFTLGQVIQVRVLSVNGEKRKINLTLEKFVENEKIVKSTETLNHVCFPATVIGIGLKGLNVVFGEDNQIRGFVPEFHLSDSTTDLDLLLATYKVGDILPECVIFSKGSAVTVSAKPAIVKAIKEKSNPLKFEQLEVGGLVVGVVESVHETLGYFVELAGSTLRGLAPRLPVDDGEDNGTLSVGQTVIACVSKLDAEKRRFGLSLKLVDKCLTDGTKTSILLLTQRLDEKRRILEYYAEEVSDVRRVLAREFKVGQIVKCKVTHVTSVGLICTLANGVKGVVTAEHLSKPLEFYDNRRTEDVEAFVLNIDFKDACLELSLLKEVLTKLKKLAKGEAKDLPKDEQKLPATVLHVREDIILVSMETHAHGALAFLPGRVHYNDVHEHLKYKIGQSIHVVVKQTTVDGVLVCDFKNERKFAKALLEKLGDGDIAQPLQKWVFVELGKIYDGHVTGVDRFYVELFIKKGQRARIHVSELADSFEDGKSPMDSMKTGRPIRVKVIGIVKLRDGTRVAECSARLSKIQSTNNKKRSIGYKEHFAKGEKVSVFIDRFVDDRCFVEISPQWKGFIRTQYLSMDPSVLSDPAKYFKHGDVFEARALSVQPKEKRIFLSLLKADEKPVMAKKVKRRRTTSKDEENVSVKRRRKSSENKEAAEKAADEKKMARVVVKSEINDDDVPRLHVDGGFSWTSNTFSMKNLMEVGLNDSGENDQGHEVKDEEMEDVKPSLDKNSFKATKVEEERLMQKELSLLNPERALDTEEDFDRLLMGSPDSSLLWLRYMAMYLQASDFSKARAVAERALKTISVKEENERFNIWTAMMNLENMYGTAESLADIFERARQVIEPFKLYSQLLKIYQRSHKTLEANDLAEEMLKKFKSKFDAWILLGEHFYTCQPPKEEHSRELMQRSLKSLPESQVDLVSRFAQMEFKYADSERGRTLFENLVNEFPKRTDIWSVYIDMTVKHRNADEARVLFERVTSLKLPTKQNKSLYKKWLDFETKHGTNETRKQLRERTVGMFYEEKEET